MIGRPTDYSDEILEKTKFYLANYKSLGDIIPSIAGLACYVKIGRQTIYNWGKDDDKKEFLYILEELLAKQESTLLNGGLSGDLNSTITKLVLTKHDYSDRSDNTSNGKEIGTLPTVINIYELK